eukprot:scaffold82905_cov18-Tisochrysis_lutea.AAC.1
MVAAKLAVAAGSHGVQALRLAVAAGSSGIEALQTMDMRDEMKAPFQSLLNLAVAAGSNGIEALQAMDMSDDNDDGGMDDEGDEGDAMAVDGPAPSGRPMKGK